MTSSVFSSNTFEVNTVGLREIMGGVEAYRHSTELVANVFDEARGYGSKGKKPTFCKVTLTKDGRDPATLIVEDNGGGFKNVSDIWTFFSTTPKRSDATVSGRFNAGEKQLLATAIEATVLTNNHTVIFRDGKRSHTKHRDNKILGTKITATFRWNKDQFGNAVIKLMDLLPPKNIEYIVNDVVIKLKSILSTVNVTLPTVLLQDIDGVNALRQSNRKTIVEVVATNDTPMIYELGIPIVELDNEFPHSLNVMQKIPVPMSRDVVSETYVNRLIGKVLEASTLDGVDLLDESHANSAFTKKAWNHIQEPEALERITDKVLPNTVLWSSDTEANELAIRNGKTIIPRNSFEPQTVKRFESNDIRNTSKHEFGLEAQDLRNLRTTPPPPPPKEVQIFCPKCGAFCGTK